MIDSLFKELHGIQDFSINENIINFEKILEKLMSLNNPEIIPKLLSFLDDACEFPEVMFSIIHTIEVFDDNQYIKQLLLALPNAWNLSPYWIKVLHFRILNSKSTMEEYMNQVKIADPHIKDVVKKIIEKINSDSPKFKDKCNRVFTYIL